MRKALELGIITAHVSVLLVGFLSGAPVLAADDIPAVVVIEDAGVEKSAKERRAGTACEQMTRHRSIIRD